MFALKERDIHKKPDFFVPALTKLLEVVESQDLQFLYSTVCPSRIRCAFILTCVILS